MDGHNADQVVRIFDHHRGETLAGIDHGRHALDDHFILAAERQAVNAFFGDHHELSQVDRVRTFTQDLALGTSLTTVGQKVHHVLEVIGGGVGCQHLHGAKRLTIARKDVTDLALGDSHQGCDMYPVLDGHQVMQTTTQNIGLVSSLFHLRR